MVQLKYWMYTVCNYYVKMYKSDIHLFGHRTHKPYWCDGNGVIIYHRYSSWILFTVCQSYVHNNNQQKLYPSICNNIIKLTKYFIHFWYIKMWVSKNLIIISCIFLQISKWVSTASFGCMFISHSVSQDTLDKTRVPIQIQS